MKKRELFFVLIYSMMFSIICQAQFYNKEVAATINLEVQDNNMLQIAGSAENKTELNKSLRYTLSVIKSGKKEGNSNKNSQKGRFVLEPNSKKGLSKTTINITAADRTIILLLIYDEKDKIVGKDRKVLNGVDEEDAVTIVSETNSTNYNDVKKSGDDGFILRGMVVEDTKTKAGRDFYDLFYSLYLANNINGEKIIKIQEKLAIANNTQIQVVAGDQILVQFIINPRSQYLKAMAEHSLNKVNYYFQRLQTTKEQIKRY